MGHTQVDVWGLDFATKTLWSSVAECSSGFSIYWLCSVIRSSHLGAVDYQQHSSKVLFAACRLCFSV